MPVNPFAKGLRLSPSGPYVPNSFWVALLTFLGIIPGALVSVANIAALAALDASGFSPGARAYVQTLRQPFTLTATSIVPPDGITVVAALGLVNTVWIREQPSSDNNPWWKTLTWFVDPLNGDDEHFGNSPATALRTFAEYLRRVGQNQTINADVSVTIIGSTDEVLNLQGLHITGAATNRLLVIGQGTVSRTGTVAAFTPVSVGTEGTITDAGVADWTADEGKLIRFTSGNAAGYATFISDTATAGVGTGRLGKPVGVQGGGYAGFGTGPSPAPGDTYEILTLPQMPGYSLDVVRDSIDAGGSIGVPGLVVQNIDFSHPGGQEWSNIGRGPMRNGQPAAIVFVGCGMPANQQAGTGHGAAVFGCTTSSLGSSAFYGGSWVFLSQAGGSLILENAQIGTANDTSYVEVQLLLSQCTDAGNAYSTFGVFNAGAAAPAILMNCGSRLRLGLCWGDGTGTVGVAVEGYLGVPAAAPNTIVGAGGAGTGVSIGTNVMAWASTPWKNTLPNQAIWTGAAAQGTDSNDYHVITV